MLVLLFTCMSVLKALQSLCCMLLYSDFKYNLYLCKKILKRHSLDAKCCVYAIPIYNVCVCVCVCDIVVNTCAYITNIRTSIRLYVTEINTTFNIFQHIVVVSFIRGGNRVRLNTAKTGLSALRP